MNSNHANESYGRMMEAAKLRATQLRRQAIADFWRDAGAAARQAGRSAQRLASRLARHSRLRQAREA